MNADVYLRQILEREAVDTGFYSPVRGVTHTLEPLIRDWAGTLKHDGPWSGFLLLDVSPSGSFAKGTANNSGTDIDLFISLSDQTANTLQEIYESLHSFTSRAGYAPRRQNVSIGVRVGRYDVDLVPARKQNRYNADHSLYRRRAGSWTKTNVQTHIQHVQRSGRQDEIRVLKLWRDQHKLDFPSFYLELTVIEALTGKYGSLSANVISVLDYLSGRFENARLVDPANSSNVISEDLTGAEQGKIKAAALATLRGDWSEVIR